MCSSDLTTTYRFVSKEKDVFYDGYGPQREFYLEMPGGNSYQDDEQRNADADQRGQAEARHGEQRRGERQRTLKPRRKAECQVVGRSDRPSPPMPTTPTFLPGPAPHRLSGE